jgi:O-acetyl-ADP-ribose deacetylase (regulator of RNase III)
MKLLLCSFNEIFLDRCREYFSFTGEARKHEGEARKHTVEIYKGDIRDVPREKTAFVSPANSLGFMDGGIDMIFSREMFPGCEKDVKKKIGELDKKTLIGRPYLRVGSALWVPVGEKTALIAAPTMFLPHPIPHTQNVYWAMQAALLCAKKIPFIDTLVVTSMGCGIGCMDPESAALQIRAAWREFEEDMLPEETEQRGNSYAILESHDHAQPSNYDNREIGIAWPAGWEPATVVHPGPVKQVLIQPTCQMNHGNSVCYDA